MKRLATRILAVLLSIPDDNSDISIDLEGLNPGIYIVTAGNSSFKISMYQ